MSKLKKDQVLGIIGLVIAVLVAWQSTMLQTIRYEGDPGPKMFPFMASGLIAVCSIVVIVRPSKNPRVLLTAAQWLEAAKLFCVYLASLALFWLFGFNVAVPITLFIITMMFSKVSNANASLKKRLIISIVYAVAGFGILYLMYVVALDASLPKGIIWKMLN